VKCAREKLSKYCTDVTPTMGMLLVPGHILESFRQVRLFRKWDKGMDINPKDETTSMTLYQEAFPKYVENEHSAKPGHLPII